MSRKQWRKKTDSERRMYLFHLSELTMCQSFDELGHQVADAINTWDVFTMPKEDRIKLWIKYTVIYQYDSHETCIDTSSIKHLSDNSLMVYYRRCVSEVEALRRDKMGRNFTLHDFVTKGNSLDTGLTDEDFMRVCRHRSANAQHEIYPIYEDMVFDRATETFWRLSGRRYCIWRSIYKREWEDIFHRKTVMLRIGTSHSVTVIDKKNGVREFSELEDVFPNWEELEAHCVDEAKLLLKKTLLILFFQTSLYSKYINLPQYKALSCYPFLRSYCNACLLEVKMMQKDLISVYLSLSEFLYPYYTERGEIAPANAFRDKIIFKKVLTRKYILYRDIIANGIKRSFLNNMTFDQCISIVVLDNESKNEAGYEGVKDIISVPHVIRKVCDFLPRADLLNLVLAFSNSYNNPYFVAEPPAPRKRKWVAL